jgi:kynurenine 3-monooxygenase
MTLQANNVTVLGAGLVGSLLSIYLARRGYNVDIYERRNDMRVGNAGAGRSINLALSERGWLALERVGIREQIENVAIAMKGRMVHGVDGALSFQPYGKEGQAIYSVSRGGLNATLMDCAQRLYNIPIHFEHRCANVDLSTKALHFETPGASVTKPYDVLFGADGAFSALRASLQRTDRFEYSQSYIDHGYKELTIPAGPNGTWLIEKNALHIWPRKNFMLIALPNLDGSFTCTLFFQFDGEESFSTVNTPEKVKAFFEKYFADAIQWMPDYVEQFMNNPTSSLVTVRCFPWSHDSACLIGDAAHAIVPFFGQGMNAGFEDCRVLDELMNDHSDWQELFDAFQKSRKPNADAIAELALNNFIEMRDLVADPHFLKKKKIEKRIGELYPDTFVSAYGMVSFTHLPYSEALRRGREQSNVLEKLAAVTDLSDESIKQESKSIATDPIVGAPAHNG